MKRKREPSAPKAGAKANPLCAHCKKRGRYRTTVLAQKLLQAATLRSSVSQIDKHLADEKPLHLSLPKIAQRSLKRAKSKRFWKAFDRSDHPGKTQRKSKQGQRASPPAFWKQR